MTKRYLVYKNWNGQIHCSIEHGEHHTGDGKKKDLNELQRFEIAKDVYDTEVQELKKIYPLEEVKDEASINS